MSTENRKGEVTLAPPAAAEAHAPHGERGDFLKLTVTLSPEVYELVLDEMRRRKLARLPNSALSAILREAVVQYLPRRGVTETSQSG